MRHYLYYIAGLINEVNQPYITIFQEKDFGLSTFEKDILKWNQLEGDKTLRLDYDLNNDSIVLDVGGYEGQWASDIFAKYGCRIYIFEPVSSFCHKIKDRFIKNTRINVHNFGLSDRNDELPISLDGSRSSTLYGDFSSSNKVNLKRFKEWLQVEDLESIDLMKINIEGGEYALLKHIYEEGLMAKIKNFQIQFHDLNPNSQEEMKNIQKYLEKTRNAMGFTICMGKLDITVREYFVYYSIKSCYSIGWWPGKSIISILICQIVSTSKCRPTMA